MNSTLHRVDVLDGGVARCVLLCRWTLSTRGEGGAGEGASWVTWLAVPRDGRYLIALHSPVVHQSCASSERTAVTWNIIFWPFSWPSIRPSDRPRITARAKILFIKDNRLPRRPPLINFLQNLRGPLHRIADCSDRSWHLSVRIARSQFPRCKNCGRNQDHALAAFVHEGSLAPFVFCSPCAKSKGLAAKKSHSGKAVVRH